MSKLLSLMLCHFPLKAPCLPTNVKTAAECHADMLITTWDSAAGALSYTVEAQGNTGETYNCSSSSNSCAVTGVPCGEHLSVWITASSDKCTTNRVLGEVAQTGMQLFIKRLKHGYSSTIPLYCINIVKKKTTFNSPQIFPHFRHLVIFGNISKPYLLTGKTPPDI